jgi:hypothetical protein
MPYFGVRVNSPGGEPSHPAVRVPDARRYFPPAVCGAFTSTASARSCCTIDISPM